MARGVSSLSLCSLMMLTSCLHGLLLAYPSTACTKAAITAILPTGSNATISYAVSVPANGTFGGGRADLEFPVNDTGLPALCAVAVNVPSSNTSSYNFGLFLPLTEQWNGRFIASGNGGFG
jgi:feruloyl esterase